MDLLFTFDLCVENALSLIEFLDGNKQIEVDQVKEAELHFHQKISSLKIALGWGRTLIIPPDSHEPADINIDHNILCFAIIFCSQNQACHCESIDRRF
jgi:hypothetical protein